MSTEEENKLHVNLRLAPHMGAKLDALCAYYDSDRTHALRRLIYEEYERLSRAGSIPAAAAEVLAVSGKPISPDPPGGESRKENATYKSAHKKARLRGGK